MTLTSRLKVKVMSRLNDFTRNITFYLGYGFWIPKVPVFLFYTSCWYAIVLIPNICSKWPLLISWVHFILLWKNENGLRIISLGILAILYLNSSWSVGFVWSTRSLKQHDNKFIKPPQFVTLTYNIEGPSWCLSVIISKKNFFRQGENTMALDTAISHISKTNIF